MKLSDIVVRLASQVSRYSQKFHDTLTYTSIEVSDDGSGLVTVTTAAPHGLKTGGYISISNMEVHHNVISLTQDDDGIATVELDSDHDLTQGYQQTVNISGANEDLYNGIHELLRVPNRRFFTYKINSTAPDVATGDNIIFKEVLEYGYDGAYRVTVIDDTHFTFVILNDALVLDGFNGIISIGHRIYSCVDIQRFTELYEKELQGRYVMVACMDDATFSKNRNYASDVLDITGRNVDIRQGLIEPFSVFIFIPTANDPYGTKAVDSAYTELKNALYQSLIGVVFNEYLTDPNQWGVAGIGHNYAGYNKAYYVHQYKFETFKEITLDDSAVGQGRYTPTRAFRDIILNMQNSYEVNLNSTLIDLDDIPLGDQTQDMLDREEGEGNVLGLEIGFGSGLALE